MVDRRPSTRRGRSRSRSGRSRRLREVSTQATASACVPASRSSVTPDDYGKVPVVGELVTLDLQEIAIRRVDERAGEVVVHFPRIGYTVATVS